MDGEVVMTAFDIFIQAGILILGGFAVALLAHKEASVRKWGYVTGLASEPFWIYAAVTTDQWGVVLIALWWAWWYYKGALNNWNEV